MFQPVSYTHLRLIMKSILGQNKREVKHIGCKRFGIQYPLKGIYTHNGLLYFHKMCIRDSYVFDVEKKDSIKTLLLTLWKSEDDKVTKTRCV